MANGRSLKKQRILELELQVSRLLQHQPEIVLGTTDIEDFLGGRKLTDGVETMEILRDLARQNDWSLFVFDYGARVRIGVNGARTSSANHAASRRSLGLTNAPNK